MAACDSKLQLEERAFKNFMQLYKKGKFGNQRLGQAFYDHFKLHRLVDQKQLNNLHSKDGDAAVSCIRSVFKFN